MEFTTEQKTIINSNAQYINVTAGAGCGKTTTIIGYCQQHKNEQIAAITFTRDATQHLQAVLPENVTTSTIDSFILQMLNRTDQYHYQLDLSLQRIATAIYPYSTFNGTYDDYLIFLQNTLLDKNSRSKFLPPTDKNTKILTRVFNQPIKRYYQTPLPDILDDTYYVTNDTANVALSYRLSNHHDHNICPFDTLIIDESQDMSALQYHVLMLLKQYYPKMKIIIIGDISQSIYRFRNASPENIIKFQQIATNYHLTINFRAKNQGLLIIPNLLLNTNHDNINHIKLTAYQTQRKQNTKTLWLNQYQDLKTVLQNSHQQQQTIGIIANTNRDLQQVMQHLNIDYENDDPFKLCDRFINDIYWLQSQNPALLPKYQHNLTLLTKIKTNMRQLIKQNQDYLTTHPEDKQTIIDLVLDIQRWYQQPTKDLYQSIIEQNETLQQLPIKKQPYITPYLFCGTVHAAKGLEFDTVIYIPNDNYLSTIDDCDRHEQENRIYVAMTRATTTNVIFDRFLHDDKRYTLPEFQAISASYAQPYEKQWYTKKD